MSKRVKYVGGARPGVEVDWSDPDSQVRQYVTVEYDQVMPDKSDAGIPVPDDVVERLLEQDDWAEVKRSAPKEKGD